MRALFAFLCGLAPVAIGTQTAAVLQHNAHRDAANYVGFISIMIGGAVALAVYMRNPKI